MPTSFVNQEFWCQQLEVIRSIFATVTSSFSEILERSEEIPIPLENWFVWKAFATFFSWIWRSLLERKKKKKKKRSENVLIPWKHPNDTNSAQLKKDAFPSQRVS